MESGRIKGVYSGKIALGGKSRKKVFTGNLEL